ncbi:MAG: hypothetical protein R3C18_08755 [Planctomycetaceae bacterium]
MVTNNPHLDDFRRQLTAQAARLSEQLRSQADGLASDSATIPTAELIDELQTFFQRRDEYSVQLAEFQSRLLTPEQQDAVTHILRDFLSIQSKDTSPALEEQQSAARTLLDDIASPTEEQLQELTELAEGRHHWLLLTEFIRNRHELSDADWIEKSGIIRDQFPKQVASAALRNRLYFQEESVGETVSDEIVSEEPAPESSASVANDVLFDDVPEEPATPVIIPEIPDVVDEAFEGESIFDDIPVKPRRQPHAEEKPAELQNSVPTFKDPAEETEALHNALFDNDYDDEEIDSGILKQHHRFEDPKGESARLAARIIDGDSYTRSELLPDLILALIFEGRSGFAYHLARSLEAAPNGSRRALPSWMIRAWTLGSVIMFPQGQLVGTLQDDFGKAKNESQRIGDETQRITRQLFLQAAALRPAIVAPATHAAEVVSSFPMSPELIQLYNYCARIGRYGEKIGGLTPSTFKRTDGEQDERLLEDLQQDVAKWVSESETFSVRYAMTNPLFTRAHWSLRSSSAHRYPSQVQVWQRWQKTLQTADTIVGNILHNRVGAVADTRQEMQRIASIVSQDRRVSAMPMDNDMRNFLLQAVTFGQRWTSLHGGHSDGFIPLELQELRDEIESRHDLVIQELKDLAERNPVNEVRSAVGCLILAMEQVRDLVDPDVPAERSEPNARELLHAELLRIPTLEFSATWMPECDPEALTDRIIEYLVSPRPSWTTAIQLQLANDNVDSAEKTSSLPVFTRLERQQLQKVLAKYRKQQQDEIWKDLRETESMIEQASRMQIFSEQDRAGFAARLERLRQGLSISRNHTAEAEEIKKLRQAIERRRTREATLTQERLQQLSSDEMPKPAPPASDWRIDFTSD